MLFDLIVLPGWIAFALYWLSSWFYERATCKEKPIEKSASRFGFWPFRIILIFAVAVILIWGGFGFLGMTILPVSLTLAIIGVIIQLCGIGFAIWARRTLGSNWSMTIVLKKGQTLTKTGPYSVVRHPIYTGILFGTIGTFLVIGNIITLIFVLGIFLFTFNRVRIEEKLMLREFGKQYVQYSRSTKKIIPFVY